MTEISELVGSVDMYELACKTNAKVDMEAEEKELIAELDARFKEIGKTGHDADHEISQFIRKTINEEIENTPDELLDRLFERSNIGINDDFEAMKMPPKNTLMAHLAAPGGNVEKSFLDVTAIQPVWRNRQVETDISYRDIERNGWKTVARITEYANAAFMNAMFADAFDMIDAGITSGAANYINETGTKPTQASMDALRLYVADRANGDGLIVGLNKYIYAASKLTGFNSNEMLNEIHRNGSLGMYDGVDMFGISGAKTLGDGSLLIKDHRLFGVAGKIGSLAMRGDVVAYQDADNNKESFHIMLKGFNYGIAMNADTLQNVAKMVIA